MDARQSAQLDQLSKVMTRLTKQAREARETLESIQSKTNDLSEDEFIRTTQEQSRRLHTENRALKEELRQLKEMMEDKVLVNVMEYESLTRAGEIAETVRRESKESVYKAERAVEDQSKESHALNLAASADKANIAQLEARKSLLVDRCRSQQAELQKARKALEEESVSLLLVRAQLDAIRNEPVVSTDQLKDVSESGPPKSGVESSVSGSAASGSRKSRPACNAEDDRPIKKISMGSPDRQSSLQNGTVVTRVTGVDSLPAKPAGTSWQTDWCEDKSATLAGTGWG